MPEHQPIDSPEDEQPESKPDAGVDTQVSRRSFLKFLAGGAGAAGLAGAYVLSQGEPEEEVTKPKVAIGNFIDVRDEVAAEYLYNLKIDARHEMLLRSAQEHGCFLTMKLLGTDYRMRSGIIVGRKLKDGSEVSIGQVSGHGLGEQELSELISILQQYGTVPEPPEPEDQCEIHEQLKPHLDELKYGYKRAGWEKDDVAEAVGKMANFDPSWKVRVHHWDANPLKHPKGIHGLTAIHPDNLVVQGWLNVGEWGLDYEVDLSGERVTIGSQDHEIPEKVLKPEEVPAGVRDFVRMLEEHWKSKEAGRK